MLLENVVIGNSLPSILFAYFNQYYYIPTSSMRPFFFEDIGKIKIFGTNNSKKIYEEVKTLLGFLGLNLDYSNLKQIRIDGNRIKVFDDSLLLDFLFGVCYISDTTKISHNNKILETKDKTFKVVDDFKVSRFPSSALKADKIITGDDFVSDIHFYNSGRVDGSSGVTDIVALSEMTREQINDFNYSDTMALFKVKNHLSRNGYVGLKEKAVYKSGKNRIKKILLEHAKRFVHEIDNNQYESCDLVKFINPKIRDFF